MIISTCSKFLLETSPTPIYQRIVNGFKNALIQLGHEIVIIDTKRISSIEEYVLILKKEAPDFLVLTNPLCLLSSYSEELQGFIFEKLGIPIIFVHHDNIFSDLSDLNIIRKKLISFLRVKKTSWHFCLEYENCLDLRSLGINNAFSISHASEFTKYSPEVNFEHEVSFLGHILPSLSTTIEEIPFSHYVQSHVWHRIVNLDTKLGDYAAEFATKQIGEDSELIHFLSFKYFYISLLHSQSHSFRGEIIKRIDSANVDIIGGDTAYIHGSNRNLTIKRKNIRYYPVQTNDGAVQKIYQNSQINLNITSLQFDDAVINRVIDIGAVGGFVLTDWRSDLETLTGVHQEISYKSIEELNDKIAYYLHQDHHQERLDIAEVLHQDIGKKHNYLSVVMDMISRINTSKETMTEPLRIDLGCGIWKPEGFIGVDISLSANVDVVANLNRRFPFGDNSAEVIRAHDVVEHLDNRIHTMNELWRVSKPDALIDIRVPSTDGRGAFQDPTHVSFWNINSFLYYCVEYPEYLKLCHSYGFKGAFSLVSLEQETSDDEIIHVHAVLKAVKDTPIQEAISQNVLQSESGEYKHGQDKVRGFARKSTNGNKKLSEVLKLSVSDIFGKALNFHQQKQHESARNCYQEILTIDPNHLDSLSNLGSVLKNLGRYDEAIACYQRVLELRPEQVETWFNLGNAYQIENKLLEAETAFARAIAIKSDFGAAHFKLAKVLQEQDKFMLAVDHYKQAIALEFNLAEAHYNLGNTLFAQKEYELAIAAFQQAITFKPDFVRAYIRLGMLHQQTEDFTAAEVYFRQALQLYPNEIEAFDNLIFLLHKQRKSEQAIALLQDKLDQDPNHANAYSHLGTIYNDLGRYDEAIANLRKALEIDATQAMTLNNLGFALIQQGQLTEAIANFQSAINIAPDLAAAHLNLGHALCNQGRVAEGIARFKETVRLEPDYYHAYSNFLYALNYESENTPEAIATAHRDWGDRLSRQLIPYTSWENTLQSRRKLRVGYVSPDFRKHSVAYFIEPILTDHNSRKVETFCYANVLQTDDVTDRLKSVVHNWRDIYSLTDSQVAELIRRDRIDILVDLAGHTGSSRLPVFALKPAPIQITYLGYPNTSGLSAIDYRLTDSYADPVGMTEDFYTEKLLRFPNSFLCYQAPENTPDVIEFPAKTIKRITFGSFNNLPKITESVIDLWAKVLHAVPNSRMILKINWFDDAGTRDRYWQLFGDRGITPERVKLIGLILDSTHHLAFYGNIDIALDPFPYNGTTTTCEALWMGVPVITLAGQTHVSRVGVSLLNAVGLPELIANSPDEYISVAVKLASDWESLNQLRQNLRTRVANSSLGDRAQNTQNIETIYQDIWLNYCIQKKT